MSAIWLDRDHDDSDHALVGSGPRIVTMPHTEGVEQVLCVGREFLQAAPFTGLLLNDAPDFEAYLQAIFEQGPLCYLDRPEAEVSEEWVQLIPYCLIRRADGTYFRYRRAGSEGRLTGKSSIGVGGHINPVDGFAPSRAAYERGLRRELAEEIGYEYEDQLLSVLGLIYDPSNAVGRVHLGLFHQVHVAADFEPTVENALKEGVFQHPADFGSPTDFESWSALILRECFV